MIKWKAGIYARISTDHDNQKTSTENQISLMEEWAKSQKDVEIYDIYIDEGITGTKIDKRYSFQRMLKDAKTGKINLIIVKSITRFARNQMDSIRLARELKEQSVRIYFYQEQIDTFNDVKMLGLFAWLAENESRATSERRKLGGREAQKKGKFVTNRPPLGYKSVNGKLVINEDEAKIVRRIFDLYLEGYGFSKIAAILNEEGYRSRRGYPFRTDKIKYILNNEMYTGTFIGNRYTKVDLLSSKIVEKPKEEWIIIENNHEKIIDKEVFNKVKDLMADKSFKIGKRSVALFAGVVKCGKCGHNYNRVPNKKKGKVYHYYVCVGRRQKGKAFCNAESVKEEDLIEIINNELMNLKINQDIIENMKNKTLELIDKKIKSIDSELININNRIKEIEEDRKVLAKKNIKGIIDDELFKEMDDELKAELKTLNDKKNKNKIVDSRKVYEKIYDDFVNTIANFSDVRNLSNVEVRKLIDVIEIKDNEINIEIKINKSDFDIKESLSIDPIIETNYTDEINKNGLHLIPIVSTIDTKCKQKKVLINQQKEKKINFKLIYA